LLDRTLREEAAKKQTEKSNATKISATAIDKDPKDNTFTINNPYKKITKHWGKTVSDSIDHYILSGGYEALNKAISMKPEEIVQEVEKSKLRGRGGVCLLTAEKWKAFTKYGDSEKYIICNGTESSGQSGSVQLLLTSEPHLVLEGIVISAYALGVGKGIICLNTDNQVLKVIEGAVHQMRESNILGDNILNSHFSFDLEIRLIPDTTVAFEETFLLKALEGKKIITSAGLFGRPTLIHTAETMVNIPYIVSEGAQKFINSETKLITLSGDIKHSGVIEVSVHTSLAEVIYDLAGGIPTGRPVKLVQVGGLTGGFISGNDLQVTLDYSALKDKNISLNSSWIEVYDDSHCVVDVVKNIANTIKTESCGKCVLCREGILQLSVILSDITEGRGRKGDLELLTEIGENIRAGGGCNFGKTAADPILTTLQAFYEEYEKHLKRKRCDALVCQAYITYHILPEKCSGCGRCLTHCPAKAIRGEEKMIHVVDQEQCDKCGACIEICEHNAIAKASSIKPQTPEIPIPVGTWKKTGLSPKL